MEEIERLKPAVAEAERQFSEEKSRLEGQIVELGRKAENIQARVAELA